MPIPGPVIINGPCARKANAYQRNLKMTVRSYNETRLVLVLWLFQFLFEHYPIVRVYQPK